MIFFPFSIGDLGDIGGLLRLIESSSCNPGGGFSGRILPPSKSWSAERDAFSRSALKSKAKSSSIKLLLAAFGDLGVPGLSSQLKGIPLLLCSQRLVTSSSK
uniref:Uncharacterized protein n=1 Tax=Rhizophora mucronata TaxID=61149 RepID=A0A2P2PKS1_RHIMU